MSLHSLQQVALKRCTRNWLKKCGNPLHAEIAENFALKPIAESTEELCDHNLPYRKSKYFKAL